MEAQPPRRSAARLVGAIVVLLLIGGVTLAFWTRRPPPRGTAPPPGAANQDAGEGAIERALSLATDSLAIKTRWVEEPSGIDLSGLAPERREVFLRFANAERCTCGCGYTLAGCRASDMDCDVSGPRLAALLDSVRSGRIRTAEGVRERPPSEPAPRSPGG